ncbi:solute carrier family 45 member 3 [Limosa lapponica baueri]|uniref:Solute carrier family 45 member 3 n=1 Tax=Limosa lapponica baueri TaxID=1758121 RepID=A0A2I0TGY8_LIMLA|nr:solute carrier family 45 member 3 [Limosa lapponica baueri]
MGSLGLFLQCVTSIFFSTIMDRMVKQFGTRAVYLASVVFFPVAAFVMCLSHSVIIVTISAALTGFTFSALQILPYTLASLYHHEKQVVPSLFMGSIVQFTQSVTAYMVSAAGLGLVAIYFATKVVFDKSDMAKYSV